MVVLSECHSQCACVKRFCTRGSVAPICDTNKAIHDCIFNHRTLLRTALVDEFESEDMVGHTPPPCSRVANDPAKCSKRLLSLSHAALMCRCATPSTDCESRLGPVQGGGGDLRSSPRQRKVRSGRKRRRCCVQDCRIDRYCTKVQCVGQRCHLCALVRQLTLV